MSIDIYGFLGPDTQDLESRVIQGFKNLGFSAVIHPGMRLLESNPSGCLYISFIETPPRIGRICAGVPLLLGFGYSVVKRGAKSAGWPPKKVKQYAYEVCTRTAAGRSTASYFAQALTVAILAKETNGYFYINGNDAAVPGDSGLELIQGELDRITGCEFDLGAYPFEAWPPIDPNASFVWPEPIASPLQQPTIAANSSEKKRFKFSVIEALGWTLILYFLIVTIVYS